MKKKSGPPYEINQFNDQESDENDESDVVGVTSDSCGSAGITEQDISDSEILSCNTSSLAESQASKENDAFALRLNRERDDYARKRPSHLVGIGASAGGLEALQKLFDFLPTDTGAAFVIVQHLSPDFKSVMAELLSKCTDMPVLNVEDGVEIQPNTVYLIRPRKNLIIAEWRLYLSDQVPTSRPNLPIDVFFRSMAEDMQHLAIGVILSGTGSDGTRGAHALKEAGGMVVVQEPSNAKFDGMPHSAIMSGLADLILPVKEIGPALEKFIKHPVSREGGSVLRISLDDQSELMDQVFSLLRQKNKIDFSHYKHTTIARRIERRMGINQFNSLKDYVQCLREKPSELTILAKELLIGVTRFFRDEEAFKKLQFTVIRDLVLNASVEDGIRVWVAGCSTGEEAYSIAIIIDEECRRAGKNIPVKIFATDVDTDSLGVASSSAFTLDLKQDVSPERLAYYFRLQDDRYFLNVSIRKMVIFATHNMIMDPPFSNIDLVSCRNTLIYFQHSMQKKVLASLHFALKAEGNLFLGSSESLGDLQSYFDVVDERCRLYRKLNSSRIPVTTAPPAIISRSALMAKALPPIETLSQSTRGSSWRTLLPLVAERLVNLYAPPCVVLNERFQAQHVFGEMKKFLRIFSPGKISTNIQDLVVDDLLVPVSTALHKASDTKQDVFYTDVCLYEAGAEICINLRVICIGDTELKRASLNFVLVFEEVETRAKQRVDNAVKFDNREHSRLRIKDLEQQLMKKQEHLQVTIEELETTNEELQAANEELMSANEELQSTNEELQSVNEELFTVNTEYQEKIYELTQLNGDLDNVLKSTEIALLFLDNKLQVRRFTQPIKRYIPLLPSDIGRPIGDISHKLDYEMLLGDLNRVFQTGIVVQRDLFGPQNQCLQLKVMPYLQGVEDVIDGVLVTIANITSVRFMDQALQRAHDQMRAYLAENGYVDVLLKKIAPLNILLLSPDLSEIRVLREILDVSVSDGLENVSEKTTLDEAFKVVLNQEVQLCIIMGYFDVESVETFFKRLLLIGQCVPVIVISSHMHMTKCLAEHAEMIYDFLMTDDLNPQTLKNSILYTLVQALNRKSGLGRKAFGDEALTGQQIGSREQEKDVIETVSEHT